MPSPFASDSDIVILNAPDLDAAGNLDTFFTKRTGTLPSGKLRKPRFTVEVRSEPILLNLDELNLGQSVAEAYKALLQDQGRAIVEPVKASTLKRRQQSYDAFNRGVPSAMLRYSGGRIGPKPPNPQSRFKYNDSGRMWDGLFIRQNTKDKTFTINLPTNRMNPDISGMATVMSWFADLQRLVPALNPAKAAQTPAMKTAIANAMDDMIAKAESAQKAKLHALMMARKNAIKQAAMAAIEIAGG